MSAKDCYYMDKQTLREIGLQLWILRKQRGMYLQNVATLTHLPARVVEGMELGKFIQYTAFRRLTEFYGKKMRIVFE